MAQVGAWNFLDGCRRRHVIEKRKHLALVVRDVRQAPMHVRVFVFADEGGHKAWGSDKLLVVIPQLFPSFFCRDELQKVPAHNALCLEFMHWYIPEKYADG